MEAYVFCSFCSFLFQPELKEYGLPTNALELEPNWHPEPSALSAAFSAAPSSGLLATFPNYHRPFLICVRC